MFGPVEHAPASPEMVKMVKYIAGVILQGEQFIPVKLKMMLPSLFSYLSQEETVNILHSCGWLLKDFQQGYIMNVIKGMVHSKKKTSQV